MTGALIGLIIGVIAGVFFKIPLPQEHGIYIAAVILILLDGILESIMRLREDRFNIISPVSGMIVNGLTVTIMAYIGKIVNYELVFVAILLITAGILKKFLIFRRFLLNKCEKKVTIEEEDLQKD